MLLIIQGIDEPSVCEMAICVKVLKFIVTIKTLSSFSTLSAGLELDNAYMRIEPPAVTLIHSCQ